MQCRPDVVQSHSVIGSVAGSENTRGHTLSVCSALGLAFIVVMDAVTATRARP